MTRDAAERIAIAAYRAGMKNGIREHVIWTEDDQLLGVTRERLRETLVQIDAVADDAVRSAACSNLFVRAAIEDALR